MFQVARAPGKTVVYTGAVLLILGVFAMLYIRERRLWVWIESDGAQGSSTPRCTTGALSTNRRTLDADIRVRAAPAAPVLHRRPRPSHEHHDDEHDTLTLGGPGFFARRSIFDWLFALA